jgi:hypothetical protein
MRIIVDDLMLLVCVQAEGKVVIMRSPGYAQPTADKLRPVGRVTTWRPRFSNVSIKKPPNLETPLVIKDQGIFILCSSRFHGYCIDVSCFERHLRLGGEVEIDSPPWP